jgi:hypothetical protein
LKTRRLEKSGVFILLKACPTDFFYGKTASPKFQFSSPGRPSLFFLWYWVFRNIESNTGKSARQPVLHFLPVFDFISHFYQ